MTPLQFTKELYDSLVKMAADVKRLCAQVANIKVIGGQVSVRPDGITLTISPTAKAGGPNGSLYTLIQVTAPIPNAPGKYRGKMVNRANTPPNVTTPLFDSDFGTVGIDTDCVYWNPEESDKTNNTGRKHILTENGVQPYAIGFLFDSVKDAGRTVPLFIGWSLKYVQCTSLDDSDSDEGVNGGSA